MDWLRAEGGYDFGTASRLPTPTSVIFINFTYGTALLDGILEVFSICADGDGFVNFFCRVVFYVQVDFTRLSFDS